jgi:hypothetical protein
MRSAIKKLNRWTGPGAVPVIALVAAALVMAGCNSPGSDDGDEITEIPIIPCNDPDSSELNPAECDPPPPPDLLLNLRCADVGITGETCILDDPENPYRNVATAEFNVNDPDALTKFDLVNEIPEGPEGAKQRFYLWATALARRASGENQYYTALALHEVFTAQRDRAALIDPDNPEASGDPIIREQALKAYRSTWDNFLGSVTVFTCCGEFFPDPDRGDTEFAFPINELVLEKLVRSLDTGFWPLIPDNPNALIIPGESSPDAGLIELEAQEVITSWGYVYRCTGEGLERVCAVSVAEF